MANKGITPRERQAWKFAKEAHKGQVRKFIEKPYFNAHVQKVNGIVKQYTSDEDLLITALLHDVIEDCYEDKDVGYHEIKNLFGERVANLVKELTSLDDELDYDYDGNKTDYLIDKMINMTDDALIIKLADRLQNMSDAFTATEKFRNKYFHETTMIIHELEKVRKFNRVQTLLLNEIKSKLSNIKLFFRLKRFDEI